MSGTKNKLFLLDTNAILYLLVGNSCMEKYTDEMLQFSQISYMELLGYKNLSIKDENTIKEFLSGCSKLTISDTIEKETIKLRKLYNIKLPDAIIAATAIINNSVLVSADKVFSKIKEIKFELVKL